MPSGIPNNLFLPLKIKEDLHIFQCIHHESLINHLSIGGLYFLWPLYHEFPPHSSKQKIIFPDIIPRDFLAIMPRRKASPPPTFPARGCWQTALST